ncbi:hypothetical protein [Streptomyces sp. IBSBF 3010]|uniref:hypothetical protein n=1 Tax=Streptomyces sp. IBSBF 3010 TaxID=2903526 RepID=UPI002FDBEFD2
MTQMPEGEEIRPFAVPINDGFAREAAQTLRDYREMVERCLNETEGPSQEAPVRRDVASIAATPEPVGTARGSLHGMLLDVAGMSWDTALDHVRALEHDIVRKPPPVWSPLVIARAVLESCLLFDYLFEPSISGGLRLARCAGLWRKDTDHSMNLAKILDKEEEVAKLDAYVTQALDECNAVARRSANGKITGYVIDGEGSNLDYNITGRTRDRLPEWLPMPYGLLSGAAHGRPWMTDRARALGSEGGELVGEAAMVMTALMATMASLEMGVRTWQGYFGFDLDAVLAEMTQYRQFMALRLMGFAHATE